jgi:hypothetical protein
MEPGALLQESATGSCPKPNESFLPSRTALFLTCILILFSRLGVGLPAHSGFPAEVLYAVVTSTVRAKLLALPFVLVLSL